MNHLRLRFESQVEKNQRIMTVTRRAKNLPRHLIQINQTIFDQCGCRFKRETNLSGTMETKRLTIPNFDNIKLSCWNMNVHTG